MLELLLQYEKVDVFDIKLAQLLVPEGEENPTIFYCILLLNRAVRAQHSCLPLCKINLEDPFLLANTAHGQKETVFSSTRALNESLLKNKVVGDNKPLRLINGDLYFARFDEYEKSFVNAILQRNANDPDIDLAKLETLLNTFFGQSNEPDWQKVACAVACMKRFCIISGGPGTGKTTTVTKLLAILQSLYCEVPLKIKLVAPTGKAAVRLSESVANAKQQLTLIPNIANLIPDNAQTLHRLLGVIHLSNTFRHHKQNPLDVDLLVVDEASMIDLALLAKLFDALPAHTRIILLGDKDQLSSVDTGNVMADLCYPLSLGRNHSYSASFANQIARLTATAIPVVTKDNYQLTDNLAYLQVSHRFKNDSGIGHLAKSVNLNDSAGLRALVEHGYQDLLLTPLETDFSAFIERAVQQYSPYLAVLKGQGSIKAIHAEFSKFQVLCATRVGAYGTQAVNQRIEKQLLNQGKIIKVGAFYSGMPIMISENNYQLNLFNGDIGIIVLDEYSRLMASFIDDNGAVRCISTTRLPAFETVYAMTIHKSQGSEFNQVAMILPPNSVVANRQLVYTGITRAKQSFELVASRGTLMEAMNRGISRHSGLFKRFSR